MVKVKRQKKFIFIIIIVIIMLCAFLNFQNNSIVITEIMFKNNSIPKDFNGYKILQISDLHNKKFGTNQNKILEKIKKKNPDMIVVTGDLVDSNNTNINTAMELINKAIEIAPIYYVSGNHEAWSGIYNELKINLENSGVIVLDNEKVEVFDNGSSIDIVGLIDNSFKKDNWLEDNYNLLNELTKDSTNFKILLSHRPELFNIYSNSNVDLVFSGHAHGGQFRLPYVGGIIAPDQGFFPKLTEGVHINNDTSMIISRGLGNSIIPIRIFNRPELIVVTLLKN